MMYFDDNDLNTTDHPLSHYKMIPPERLRYWARMFEEGMLDDDYAKEFTALLNFLADNAEFNLTLQVVKANYSNNSIH